jgi:hypothetical protein
MTDQQYQEFHEIPIQERSNKGRIESVLRMILQHATWADAITAEQADRICADVLKAFPDDDLHPAGFPDCRAGLVIREILNNWATPLMRKTY